MQKLFSLLLAILIVLCGPISVQAQPDEARENTANSFELFETLDSAADNRASAANSGRNNSNNNNSRNARNTPASPTFTLIGTSRIGTKEVALLKHLSGEVIRVPLGTGIDAIPGYELYSVVSHGAGQLSLRFPPTNPCNDFPESGVSCDSTSNISVLSLTTADAVVRVSESEFDTLSNEDAESEETSETVEPETRRNPFAVIRDRARADNNSTQATSTSRFQPRRIDPSDIPPGMRVVSTPFGDRLVDQ